MFLNEKELRIRYPLQNLHYYTQHFFCIVNAKAQLQCQQGPARKN